MKKSIIHRDSNFELLRVISILMIILHHFFGYSNYVFSYPFHVHDFVLLFFQSGGKLGVILFVMISGYYLVYEKKMKVTKLVELELKVLYYSIGIFLLFVLFFHREFTLYESFKFFLPNIFKLYWFFSGYFFLYLISPYLNKFIFSIYKKKNEFKRFLIICFVFLILIPSIFIFNYSINEVVYLVYYYIFGGYIRLYSKDIKGKYRYLIISCVSYALIILFTFLLIRLSFYNNNIIGYLYCFSSIHSIFVFGCGVSLFLFFKNIKIKKNRVINYLASFSFGVYLFHEHIYMREFLWGNIFSLYKVMGHGILLINGLCVAICVYMLGIVFDFVRELIFMIIKKMGRSIKLN